MRDHTTRSKPLTRSLTHSILDDMNEDRSSRPEELDIQRIEVRVEELVRAYERLKNENKSLRERQETLVRERAELIEKTEMARSRVEAMISRLKSMESS